MPKSPYMSYPTGDHNQRFGVATQTASRESDPFQDVVLSIRFREAFVVKYKGVMLSTEVLMRQHVLIDAIRQTH